MFKEINSYIALSKEERQKHLSLDSNCIEIGTTSRDCRALLAHTLGTTVPSGSKIHLCHACHNPKCSNTLHLYWGTASENLQDQYSSGVKRRNPHEIMRSKMSEEEYREARREIAKSANKTKKMRVDVISESRKKFLEEFKQTISLIDTTKRGWIKPVCQKFSISHTHVRRLMRQLKIPA